LPEQVFINDHTQWVLLDKPDGSCILIWGRPLLRLIKVHSVQYRFVSFYVGVCRRAIRCSMNGSPVRIILNKPHRTL